MSPRIGIFGGSFDPIHLGHLIMAECFRESMGLDKVVFLLAHISPFKTDAHPTGDKHRLEMLRLAISGNPFFESDDREIRRGGVSYTVESLQAIREASPDADLYMMIGSDSLKGFHEWREPQSILRLAKLVVAHRGGSGIIDWSDIEKIAQPEHLDTIRGRILDAPQIEIASRDIRRRVREERTIRYLVSPAVEAYIYENRLWMESTLPHGV
ncbi:MAG: nicotinate-nucleotide adenylyltransferase [Pirellula sp.]|jgi:nicotinate-nucleotide adenylyltransferase|nr:nicotinate-nucleotide adenylyltransferase [Pirellula sp.]